MTFQVTLLNTKQTFETEPGETLLDVLLRNGVTVRYGCRRGKCATCKHYIVDGDYDNSEASAYALLDEEREEGLTLLCQTFALTDCTVELQTEVSEEGRIRPAKPRSLSGTVVRCEPVAADLCSVVIDLDDGLHALPGQYVEIGVPAQPDLTRTFSVASAPFDTTRLEIIVKRYPNGVFSGKLDDLVPGTALDVSGPYGGAYLRPATRPAVLLGDEAGIGPLLGMTRYAGECGWDPGMRVFHVAKTEENLVYRGELRDWADVNPGFSYHTFDSVGTAVAQAAGGEDVDVYLTGRADFCDEACFLLEARGVNEKQIHIERFYPAR